MGNFITGNSGKGYPDRVSDTALDPAISAGATSYAKELLPIMYALAVKKEKDDKILFAQIISHDVANPLTIIKYLAENLSENDDMDPDSKKNVNKILNESEEIEFLIMLTTKMSETGEEICSGFVDFTGKIKKTIDTASGELMNNGLSYKEKENINSILCNTNRIFEVIKNAYRYAQLINGEISLETGDVIEHLDPIVAKYQKETNRKIKTKYENEVIVFHDDCIEEVFDNLLSNAIKYSPEDTPIEIGVEERKNNSIWIYVKDNGDGVPDEYKDNIFERFTRQAKEGVKGTGLGLAIAKTITELHNGKIGVEDNPEGGSIFYVELPKETEEGNNQPYDPVWLLSELIESADAPAS